MKTTVVEPVETTNNHNSNCLSSKTQMNADAHGYDTDKVY